MADDYFSSLFKIFSAVSISLISIWADILLIDRYGYRHTILYLTFPEIISLIAGWFAIVFVLKHAGFLKGESNG